jgi:hypothetical protein
LWGALGADLFAIAPATCASKIGPLASLRFHLSVAVS